MHIVIFYNYAYNLYRIKDNGGDEMRNLATIRKKKGYTQIELANKAGIASNSLARYERGEMQPTIEVVSF